jgi:hypothetical protein
VRCVLAVLKGWRSQDERQRGFKRRRWSPARTAELGSPLQICRTTAQHEIMSLFP